MYTPTASDIKWAEQVAVRRCYACGKCHWCDDAKSEAVWAMFEAAKKYDPEKNEFHGYAFRRVNGAVIDFLREVHAIRRTVHGELESEHVSMSKVYHVGKELDPVTHADILPSPDPNPEDITLRGDGLRMERLMMAVLSKPEREVIRRMYWCDESQVEVGKGMEIQSSYISVIHQRALGKLKAALEFEERQMQWRRTA